MNGVVVMIGGCLVVVGKLVYVVFFVFDIVCVEFGVGEVVVYVVVDGCFVGVFVFVDVVCLEVVVVVFWLCLYEVDCIVMFIGDVQLMVEFVGYYFGIDEVYVEFFLLEKV